MRPSKKEIAYLTLAYNRFYDIFEEVFVPEFWHKNKYYRYCKIKDAFSVYSELLNYEPIQSFIETLRETRPPMEAEISSELFKFIRNVISHFPFFDGWDDVWISKDIVNWYKDGQSIDKFLRKFENHESAKYRIWEEKNKSMTYLSINFPDNYADGTRIFLKNLVTEKEGLKFSLILMRKVIDTQIEEIS